MFTNHAELQDKGPMRWLPLLSLPYVLHATPEMIPQTVPYLSAEPARVADWRRRVGAEGFKVGMTWQGNPAHRFDRIRSCPWRRSLRWRRYQG